MSNSLFEPDTRLEDLTPVTRELFDMLISKTRFLNALENILKAREYDRNHLELKEQGKTTLQKSRNAKRQIAALDIPDGYVCVSMFRASMSEYHQALYLAEEAVRDLCFSPRLKDDPPAKGGNRVRDYRIEADLSQKDLANRVNEGIDKINGAGNTSKDQGGAG